MFLSFFFAFCLGLRGGGNGSEGNKVLQYIYQFRSFDRVLRIECLTLEVSLKGSRLVCFAAGASGNRFLRNQKLKKQLL